MIAKQFISFSFFLIVVISSIEAAVPQIERDALVELYNSTDGPNWTDNTNWLTGDPCDDSWFGIYCDASNTTIQMVGLVNNQLNGNIPSEISNLSNLQRLHLGQNESTLSGPIPSELGNLANLEYLLLYSNQLNGPIPTELGNLTSLTFLSLYSNSLTGGIPSELGNLTNLKSLYLFDNQLGGTIPTELGLLTNLQYFSLDFTQITGNFPSEICYLPNLIKLSLSYNQLDGPIPTEIENLVSLEDLSFYRNQMTGTIPSELGNLPQLRKLRVEANRFVGDIPTELLNLTNLEDNESYFRWNALYTDNDTLRTFLNMKQIDGDWESTQTIAPTDVTAGSPDFTSIWLDWTPVPYTADSGGYEIYYSETQGGPYNYFGITSDKSVSSIEVTGLIPDTTYYFVLQTVTNSHLYNQNTVRSEESLEVFESTLPVVPTIHQSAIIVLLSCISIIIFRQFRHKRSITDLKTR